jgi:hypothetical protein
MIICVKSLLAFKFMRALFALLSADSNDSDCLP